jgi:hypothetical protein
MNLQGSDGTQFAHQDECVSFGAHGGTIVPKPPRTAGSENFSEDAEFSKPTTFAGGTIDGPYGNVGQVIPFSGQHCMLNRNIPPPQARFGLPSPTPSAPSN